MGKAPHSANLLNTVVEMCIEVCAGALSWWGIQNSKSFILNIPRILHLSLLLIDVAFKILDTILTIQSRQRRTSTDDFYKQKAQKSCMTMLLTVVINVDAKSFQNTKLCMTLRRTFSLIKFIKNKAQKFFFKVDHFLILFTTNYAFS